MTDTPEDIGNGMNRREFLKKLGGLGALAGAVEKADAASRKPVKPAGVDYIGMTFMKPENPLAAQDPPEYNILAAILPDIIEAEAGRMENNQAKYEKAVYRAMKKFFIRIEGSRPKMYLDTANLRTIGIGRNLQRGINNSPDKAGWDNCFKNSPNRPSGSFEDYYYGRSELNETQIDMLFKQDYNDSKNAVNRMLADSFLAKISSKKVRQRLAPEVDAEVTKEMHKQHKYIDARQYVYLHKKRCEVKMQKRLSRLQPITDHIPELTKLMGEDYVKRYLPGEAAYYKRQMMALLEINEETFKDDVATKNKPDSLTSMIEKKLWRHFPAPFLCSHISLCFGFGEGNYDKYDFPDLGADKLAEEEGQEFETLDAAIKKLLRFVYDQRRNRVQGLENRRYIETGMMATQVYPIRKGTTAKALSDQLKELYAVSFPDKTPPLFKAGAVQMNFDLPKLAVFLDSSVKAGPERKATEDDVLEEINQSGISRKHRVIAFGAPIDAPPRVGGFASWQLYMRLDVKPARGRMPATKVCQIELLSPNGKQKTVVSVPCVEDPPYLKGTPDQRGSIGAPPCDYQLGGWFRGSPVGITFKHPSAGEVTIREKTSKDENAVPKPGHILLSSGDAAKLFRTIKSIKAPEQRPENIILLAARQHQPAIAPQQKAAQRTPAAPPKAVPKPPASANAPRATPKPPASARMTHSPKAADSPPRKPPTSQNPIRAIIEWASETPKGGKGKVR